MNENSINIDNYEIYTNEKNPKYIKHYNEEIHKEIKIIFNDKNETNVINEVLNQLSKYYIEDILK